MTDERTEAIQAVWTKEDPLPYRRAILEMPSDKRMPRDGIAGHRGEWREQDSNLRRHSRGIYSAVPLAARTSLRERRRVLATPARTNRQHAGTR